MRRFFAATLVLLVSSAASAQTTPTPADISTPSQLIVEKIESGWLFAPEVRVTDLDGRASTLAGGYVGRITDRTLTFGGGAYWLTNRDDDFNMAYGGAVVQWMTRADHAIGFGLRTLVGGGSATMPRTLGDLAKQLDRYNGRPLRFGNRTIDPVGSTEPVSVTDGFFIVEPQLDLLWNLSRRYRINFGVGYRAIGGAQYPGEQVRGVSGSIALQVGGGS